MNIDIDAVRSDFPILSETVHGRPLIYLDNAASLQVSLPVIDAVTDYYRHTHANVHRGVHSLSQKATDFYEAARHTAAQFIGAADDEIIFTSGTTDGLNKLAGMLRPRLSAGTMILVSGMEHHSNLLPWQAAARDTGADLQIIPTAEDGSLDLQALAAMLTDAPAGTVIAVTLTSNVTGIVNPVGEIASLVHEAGGLLVIDAAQGMKLGKINVKTLDCDFLAFSGHKLGALTGIGVLYGKHHLLEQLDPSVTGGGMVTSVSYQDFVPAGVPQCFEAGTPHIAGAVSLAAAIRYLEKIGGRDIGKREEQLTALLVDALSAVEGICILGQDCSCRRSGAVSFDISGVHSFDLGTMLDASGIAVRTGHMCAQPYVESFGVKSVVRISPAFYNTEDEILQTAETIRKLLPLLK